MRNRIPVLSRSLQPWRCRWPTRRRRDLMPIRLERSAEAAWRKKPVQASRTLDDMTSAATWRFSGTGQITFPAESRRGNMRVLRVDMQMFVDKPAPTRNGLSSVNLQRAFSGEDWRGYNRISMWIRPGSVRLPDAAAPDRVAQRRRGESPGHLQPRRHALRHADQQHVAAGRVEIEPLSRDRVTMLEIGYWVNKMLAAPSDRIAFEIGQLELQRVDADQHTGGMSRPARSPSATRDIKLARRRPLRRAIRAQPSFRFCASRTPWPPAWCSRNRCKRCALDSATSERPTSGDQCAGQLRDSRRQHDLSSVPHWRRRLEEHHLGNAQLFLRRALRLRRAWLARRRPPRLVRDARRSENRDERRLARRGRSVAEA